MDMVSIISKSFCIQHLADYSKEVLKSVTMCRDCCFPYNDIALGFSLVEKWCDNLSLHIAEKSAWITKGMNVMAIMGLGFEKLYSPRTIRFKGGVIFNR